MAKLSIHQAAEREAIQAAASIQNDKTARLERNAAYGRAVTRYAQEIDAGGRCAWASLVSDEIPADGAHQLIRELRDWLKNGRRIKERIEYSESFATRRMVVQALAPTVLNESWIKRLFIADDIDTPALGYARAEYPFPYETPDLVALLAALSEFSERMQSDMPPKKDEVTKRLRALGASSDSLAEALDTVIRPVRHRSGGQKKTKA